MEKATAPKTQPQEPRIWSSVIRGLLLPLAEHNVDTAGLLAMHGIADSDLQKPHGEIPLKTYLKFMEAAAAQAGDPLLGLRLARSAGPETLGALGFLFLSSRTLIEAMHNFCQYMNLLQDATHVQLTQNAEEINFAYQLYHVEGVESRQDVEFSISLTCRLIRIYGGPQVELSAVTFRHAPSAPKADYQRLLKAPVYFDQETNSISFPANTGHLRGKVLDHGLSRILQDYLDEELERRNRIRSFSDQVSRALMDGSVAPPLTAPKIARHLGISQATLYRRLKGEHTTFGTLVDSRNFELARAYLAQSSLSVTQIAHLVGFADSASFTRAFSRWSAGQTPSAYRKR
ncbi:MAG: AraC family transcriptional regulator [Alphaproteobacteria bacterium]|nr:MAG: AraC family transcriptional regulator [Alphaproteobacteria bacterium]